MLELTLYGHSFNTSAVHPDKKKHQHVESLQTNTAVILTRIAHLANRDPRLYLKTAPQRCLWGGFSKKVVPRLQVALWVSKKGTHTPPQASSLTLEMLLAGHVVPDAMHLFRGDLVDGDDPPVPAEAVGHFPVIEATVLIRVDS